MTPVYPEMPVLRDLLTKQTLDGPSIGVSLIRHHSDTTGPLRSSMAPFLAVRGPMDRGNALKSTHAQVGYAILLELRNLPRMIKKPAAETISCSSS